MQKILYASVLFLIFLLFSSTSYGVNDNANCGPGKSMASNTNAIVTVNISSSFTYAAATTSSTSGCDGPFASDGPTSGRFTQIFLARNYQRISEEIAQGQGKYLETVAGLMGCPKAAKALFFQVTHQVYPELFPSLPVNDREKYVAAQGLMDTMKHHIAENPQLSQMCSASG